MFLKDESGATAIGYGLIAAGISVAIIVVVDGLGTKLNAKFTSISTQLIASVGGFSTISNYRCDVGFWHQADLPAPPINVRS